MKSCFLFYLCILSLVLSGDDSLITFVEKYPTPDIRPVTSVIIIKTSGETNEKEAIVVISRLPALHSTIRQALYGPAISIGTKKIISAAAP